MPGPSANSACARYRTPVRFGCIISQYQIIPRERERGVERVGILFLYTFRGITYRKKFLRIKAFVRTMQLSISCVKQTFEKLFHFPKRCEKKNSRRAKNSTFFFFYLTFTYATPSTETWKFSLFISFKTHGDKYRSEIVSIYFDYELFSGYRYARFNKRVAKFKIVTHNFSAVSRLARSPGICVSPR